MPGCGAPRFGSQPVISSVVVDVPLEQATTGWPCFLGSPTDCPTTLPIWCVHSQRSATSNGARRRAGHTAVHNIPRPAIGLPCGDDEQLTSQDAWFDGLLHEPMTMTVDGDRLSIQSTTGKRIELHRQ